MMVSAAALLGMTFGCGASAPLTPSSTVVTPAVSVLAIAPSVASVAGDSRVSIYGEGFTSGATVTFDSVAATSVIVVNRGVITAVTPAMAIAKTVDVVVINPDGQRGVGTESFTYAVYSVTPSATTVGPGDQLSVSWTASTPQRNEYIELYKAGDSNVNALWWIGTERASVGTVTLNAPHAAGQYEFRYVLEDGHGRSTQQSGDGQVAPSLDVC
jgi:hypothetical protein